MSACCGLEVPPHVGGNRALHTGPTGFILRGASAGLAHLVVDGQAKAATSGVNTDTGIKVLDVAQITLTGNVGATPPSPRSLRDPEACRDVHVGRHRARGLSRSMP